MARARVKKDKQASDLGEVILAEWFRLLPEEEPADQAAKDQLLVDFANNADIDSLSAAFGKVLDVSCVAIVDGNGTPANPMKIIVPLPPKQGRKQLYEYLDRNSDFRVGMGAAILFGCGR